MTSLGKQLASAEVHSSLSATSASSLAPPSQALNGVSPTSTPATSPRQSSESAVFFGGPSTASSSKPSTIGVKKAAPIRSSTPSSGMKLGGGPKVKAPTSSTLADSVAGEWEEAEEVANAWGTNDLIEVDADDDDWAGFESAPVPEIVVPPPQSYYVKSTVANGRATPTSPPKKTPVPPTIVTSIPKPSVSVSPAVPSAPSPKPSPAPVAPPSSDDWGDSATPVQSLTTMSKDEKEKEMARRRDERKAVSLAEPCRRDRR